MPPFAIERVVCDRARALPTFYAATVTMVQLGVHLHEDLLELARVVQREVCINPDILGDALLKLSLDILILLVLLSRELATELDDKLGELCVFEQL